MHVMESKVNGKNSRIDADYAILARRLNEDKGSDSWDLDVDMDKGCQLEKEAKVDIVQVDTVKCHMLGRGSWKRLQRGPIFSIEVDNVDLGKRKIGIYEIES